MSEEVVRSVSPSRVDTFKSVVRSRFERVLGHTLTEEEAFAIYKEAIHASFQFLLSGCPETDRRLAISGIGTFKVLKAKARTGAEKSLNVDPENPDGFNPRARFIPSSVIQRNIDVFYGLTPGNPDGRDPE
jgi:nucleoid DNA-binding protein